MKVGALDLDEGVQGSVDVEHRRCIGIWLEDLETGGRTSRHRPLVTWAGLRSAGMTQKQSLVAVSGLRRLHDGVFLTGHGRITNHQRWLAATLTAPETALSHASGGAFHGFRPAVRSGFEVVTRPGSGGPRRFGALLVCRSTTLAGEVVLRDGVRVTSPTRTLIDLSAGLGLRQRAKAVREGIRLGSFTALDVRLAVARYRGRRGTAGLADLATRLECLPIDRTRSDAEARALEVIDAAGLPAPEVNVRYAGEEADLSWPAQRRIVDGWCVDRISSDAVFDAPEQLVALVVSALANVRGPPPGWR